jgi:hypothetical protein
MHIYHRVWGLPEEFVGDLSYLEIWKLLQACAEVSGEDIE